MKGLQMGKMTNQIIPIHCVPLPKRPQMSHRPDKHKIVEHTVNTQKSLAVYTYQ